MWCLTDVDEYEKTDGKKYLYRKKSKEQYKSIIESE